MEMNSMVRTVVRYFSKGRLHREIRSAPLRIEPLEAREVLTVGVIATASILTPPDGSALTSNTTSLVIEYSEDVNDAEVADNYLLLDSHGHEIPLTDGTYDNGTFRTTFSPAEINNGVPLPLDTYTLFVRQNQITDADDGVPLAGPNALIVTSGPRHTASPVQISPSGSLGALSNYPVAQVGTTQPNPFAVGSGDFNRDGFADLVVVNAGTGTVNIHLGRAPAQGGGYAITPDLTLLLPIGTTNQIKDVVVGNFNDDDGDLGVTDDDLPDIAVLNFDTDSVSFFRNTGDTSGSLSFATADNLTGLNNPVQLAAGDFDGDGFLDLAAVNSGVNAVTLFINDQTGGFAPGTNLIVTQATALTSIAVGDFDNDLSPDIAVAGNDLVILFNDSTPGVLDLVEGPRVSTTNFQSLATVRVDANNTDDLVGVNAAGSLVSLLNLTTAGVMATNGTFVEETAYAPGVGTAGRLAVTNLDEDGLDDEILVTGGTASNELTVVTTTTDLNPVNQILHRARYGPVVSASSGTTVLTITSPGHGLANGDVVTISGVAGNLAANGTFSISTVTADTFQITAASAAASTGAGFWARTGNVSGASNNIGDPIVIQSSNHRLTSGTRVTINGVAGNTAANGTFVIRVINNDSFELVGTSATGNPTNNFQSTIPPGTWTVTGSLGAQTTVLTPGGPTGVAALDADSDGSNDVVTANRIGNSFSILFGANDNTFVTPNAIDQTFNNTGAVAYGDLDGDGVKDIVVVSNNLSTASSQVSVMLGHDDGTFEPAFDYPAVSAGTFKSISSVSLIDVDGDSDLDIVVTGTNSPGNDGIAILRNQIATATLQANSFRSGPAATTGDVPTQVVSGDFNGDGILDLAVSHNGVGGTVTSEKRGVTLFAGLPGGNFNPTTGAFLPVGHEVNAAKGFAATGLVAVDYDNDHDLDLALVSGTTPTNVLLLRNNGAAGLEAIGTYDAGLSNGIAIAAGDFNLDGFTDLVVASGSTGLSTGGVSVLLNEGGTGFKQAIRSDVVPGTALRSLVVSDLNEDGRPDVVVSGLPGTNGLTADNVFVLAGKSDGSFNPATPYHTGTIDVSTIVLPPSHLAIGDSPLFRLTTFTTGGSNAQTNLIANGGFEDKDLNGQSGNLTGWKAVKIDNGSSTGSAGGWGVQSGPLSPLSGASVAQALGTYQAMLDQPDVLPVTPGQANLNSPSSYNGSHVLYQDIFIPANATTLELSLRLYLRSAAAFSDPAVTPGLNYTTLNANQQVRVDVIKASADPFTVNPADILLDVFQTMNGDELTQVVPLDGFSLAGLGLEGTTVRLRIASVNNQGKLIVGVDDVKLIARYDDTALPTLKSLKLRTPGTNAGVPQTTDPTLTGQVTDNGGVSNIAYIEFDPTNTGFKPGNTFRTSSFDAAGNFTFTFPNLTFGVHTVAVRVVDRAGNAIVTTFAFEYLGLYNNEFQQSGPTGIKLSDPTLGYSAVTGRITAIATDPSDASGKTYYVGTANGGVWKTTDGGSSWTPLMDNVRVGTTRIVANIGALGVSKSNPLVLYAGLGVADLQFDSRAGYGILKSADGGKTWILLKSSDRTFANARITKILVDPTPPTNRKIPHGQVAYVAVASGGAFGAGVYKTVNGGKTWVNILTPGVMHLAGSAGTVPAGTELASVTDLVMDPFNPNRILIGLGNVGLGAAPSATAGVWITNNAVAASPTWTQVVGGTNGIVGSTLPSGLGVGTVKIGIGNGKAGDESTVYVLIGTPPGVNTPPSVNLGGYTGLFKTSNNLLNFTPVSLRQDIDLTTLGQNFQDINLGIETTYAAALAVDPTNPNVVYVGGSRKLDLSNTLTHALIRVDTGNMIEAGATGAGNDETKQAAAGNEGVFWYDIEQQASNSAGAARLLPPTITALRFDAQGRLLIGTDGGLWRGTSIGFNYDFSSGGTGVIRTSAGPVAGMKLTAINGNLQITSVTSAATDPTSLGRTYATTLTSGQAATNGPLGYVSEDLARSAGGTFNGGLVRAASPVLAPADAPTTLYRIWKNDASGNLLPEYSTDNGETWTMVPNFLVGGDTAAYFPAFALSPTKVQTGVGPGAQYSDEALFGTNRVYKTRTSGFAWDASPILTTGHFTAFGIAPNSATGYYYAGTDLGEVFVNRTGGTAVSDWTIQTKGLPTGLPVTGFSVAQNNPKVAYVTFGGAGKIPRVFVANGGATWKNASLNLPKWEAVNAVVYDNRAALGSPSGKLYVATNSGVYVQALSTTKFTRIGTMPTGPVVDLAIDTTRNILTASVQGRGAYNLAIGAASPIADQVLAEDTRSSQLKFTLNNLGVSVPALKVTAVSSDQTVVSNAGLQLGGKAGNRTLVINPVANASGETTITLKVTDGKRVFFSSFHVTVNAVNDVPTISPINPFELPLNSNAQTVVFTIDDRESGALANTLSVMVSSDNQALIPNLNLQLSGTGPDRQLVFTRAANATGTARITISVLDPNGGIGVRTFDVLVRENTALPATDDFDRGDNTFLGSEWTEKLGNIDVSGNGAQTVSAVSVATLTNVIVPNVAVSADIMLPIRTGQSAAVVARYQNSGDRDMYYAGITAGTNGVFTAFINRNVNGVVTTLASKAVPNGTGTIRLEAVGTSLKLFLDGTLLLFAYDGTFTGGTVGIRGATAGTRFDDFLADAIDVTQFNPGSSFADHFDASADGQLSHNWQEKQGNVKVGTGVATNNAATTTALLNPLFVSVSNATVTAKVTTFAAGQFGGLIARSSADGSVFYQAGLSRTANGVTAVISLVQNGVATVLGSAATAVTSGQLRFDVVGATLTLRVNGVQLVSVTDFTLSQGSFGLRGTGAVTWDDFTFDSPQLP